MPRSGENLTRENEIIDWPIFSCAAGATTKTAAVTNRAFALLKRFRPLEA